MNTKFNSTIENKLRLKVGLKILIVFIFISGLYLFSERYNVPERFAELSNQHERFGLDELISVFPFLVFLLLLFSFQQWRRISIKKNELLEKKQNELLEKNMKLQKALSEIKQLTGIIPICSSCKNIRDDKGSWQQVEVYICDHTEADFSHGICPDCARKLYPELYKEEKKSEDFFNYSNEGRNSFK